MNTPTRETWRRLAVEVLHPFRGGRQALWDLLAGSRVLAGHWWVWSANVPTLKERCERLGLSAIAVAAAGWEVGHYVAVGVPVAFIAWSAAAWMYAPPRPPRALPARVVEDSDPADDHETDLVGEYDQDAARLDLGRFLVHAVHTADRDGRKGVHVAELLADLQAEGLSPDWDVTRLRTWCEQSGIPVRRNLKIKDRGNTHGIRADDLTQALGRPLADVLADLTQDPAPAPGEGPDATPAEGPSGSPPEAAAAPPPPPPSAAPTGARSGPSPDRSGEPP